MVGRSGWYFQEEDCLSKNHCYCLCVAYFDVYDV